MVKAACWESQTSRVRTPLRPSSIKETKCFFYAHSKFKIVRNLRDREISCSASDRQGSNLESCVWRAVSSHPSHHPQEVFQAQFSLYVHKGGLKPDSFNFIFGQVPVQPHTPAVISLLETKSDTLGSRAQICTTPDYPANTNICITFIQRRPNVV